MDYVTKADIVNWVNGQPEGALFCEHCSTRLKLDDQGNWYCPNEMCLYDESGKIDREVELNLN